MKATTDTAAIRITVDISRSPISRSMRVVSSGRVPELAAFDATHGGRATVHRVPACALFYVAPYPINS
jgi:hypothetical protein